MWSKLPLLEYFEYVQQLKLRLGSRDLNENFNIFTSICIFLFALYLIFYKILKKLLSTSKIPKVKHASTINYTFNILFFLTSTSFLILYHNYFINPELNREIGKWYPKRKSLLFYQSCDVVRFKIITFTLSSFNTLSCFIALHSRDISNAISQVLYSCLIVTCYLHGYENYSVVLSINLGLFKLFTDLLHLLALHSDKEQATLMFRVFVSFKFASWIYMFLNFLPFQYMIPTLHAKDFKLNLNIFFTLWYITQVWTSPLLHVLHHQLYHITAADCPGENSLARCLMLKDSLELHQQNNLRRAYLEVKLHHQRHQLNKLNLSESAASSTAFQTIKCMMTLKRKLKRIRENQRNDQRIN